MSPQSWNNTFPKVASGEGHIGAYEAVECLFRRLKSSLSSLKAGERRNPLSPMRPPPKNGPRQRGNELNRVHTHERT